MKIRRGKQGGVRRPSGGPQSGGVLLFALITVLTVSVLAASYAQVTSAVTRRQGRSVDTKQAFYLAEAGLAESFAGLMVGKTGTVGSEQAPAVFGSGLFWVEATEIGLGNVRLESTAMSGGGRAHLSLVVEKGGTNFGRLGVFSDDDLTVPDGVLIDGFDSRKGTYAEQAVGDPMQIGGGQQPPPRPSQLAELGTNGDITVTETGRTPTLVFANLNTGPQGQVTVVGTPDLQGAVTASTDPVELPAVVVPPLAQQAGVAHSNGLTLVIPPGDASYEYLSVTSGSELVIQGPASIVVEDLEVLGSSSTLVFDTGLGPIELFVSGSLTFQSGSRVEMSCTNPSDVRVFVTGAEPATLSATSTFHGMLYAPAAAASVGRNFVLFGSLTADALAIAPGAKLHFDQYLNYVGAKVGLPCKLSWRIVSLDSPVPGGAAGIDPFRFLGLDPATLLSPSESHADSLLELDYLDLGGVPRTYSGPESAFDWTQVQSVTSGTRNGISLKIVAQFLAALVPLN